MQLTHFHDVQNGHMKPQRAQQQQQQWQPDPADAGSTWQQRGNRWTEGGGGGQSKWCVCTKIVRFLTLNGRKQANLFHKFARWLDATPESSSCCLQSLPSPLLPPATCYTVDCSAKQLTKTADRARQEKKEKEQAKEQPGVAESRLNSNWRCN